MDIMWKHPAVPRHVVQVVPVDQYDQVLLMYRGPTVRSAPNVWSFPSGLHDIGETAEECAARELEEECSLEVLNAAFIGMYENMPGDGYHWVISLFAARVDDVSRAINREPNKHPEFKCVLVGELMLDGFWNKHPFHSSADKYFREHKGHVQNVLYTCVKP